MRVLVADDVESVCLSIAAALSAAGHEVVVAHTGRQAMEALEGGGFEAAVIDLWMPDGDGLSVIRRLRAEMPDLRTIPMTGGGPGMPLEAAALMAEAWSGEKVFVKPFRESDLVEALDDSPEAGRAAGRCS